MLIAYLDEFGHIGPYVSREHENHKTHPVFGYAGFVIPVENVREFGGFFEYIKENLLRWEIERAGVHPRRWEKKGSSLLTANNYHRHGKEILPALDRLMKRLSALGGQIVFYGMEKERGAHDQESSASRSTHMLINSVRNLSNLAASRDEQIMIFLDAVDEAPRLEAVSSLGGFIYSASEENLRRVVEVPMQLESKHYGNVQFADWVCGLVGRVSDFHFANTEEFSWAPDVYSRLVHQKNVAHYDSFIRFGRTGFPKGSIHSRDLIKDESWSRRSKRLATDLSSRPTPRKFIPTFVQNVQDANPALQAFHDSLKAKPHKG